MATKKGPKEWIPRGISNIMHMTEMGRHKLSDPLKSYIKEFEEHAQDADFVSRDGWRWFSWYDLMEQAENMELEVELKELEEIHDKASNIGDLFVGIPPEPGWEDPREQADG